MRVGIAADSGRVRFDQRPIPRFDSLPKNHCTLPVDDPWMFPYLRPAEFAVVDLTDNAPADKGLFLVQHATGERWRGIRQLKRGRALIGDAGRRGKQSICWWVGDPVTPAAFLPKDGFGEDLNKEIRRLNQSGVSPRVIQGPFQTFNMRKALVGRVVGYATSAFGQPLSPTAGWSNELQFKAVFDPAEYLTFMLETGHNFRVRKNAAGDFTGFDLVAPKKPLSGEQWRQFCRINDARLRASHALQLIMEECVQRGLFGGKLRIVDAARPRAA